MRVEQPEAEVNGRREKALRGMKSRGGVSERDVSP